MRAAPYIKPTTIDAEFHIVPEHLFLRLFPDLQNSRYVLWGVSMESPEVQKTVSGIQQYYEKEMKHPVHMLSADKATALDVANCKRPCWIFFAEDQAHELEANAFVDEKIRPITNDYISITWINFTKPEEVPQECIEQKRLDLHCMKWVSLRDAQKRFKDEGQRYFFLRKYLDHDYFLFVRTAQ